nr:MAG TPA: hypothetical protein [Caudoviricetes sp.]
MLRSMDQVSLLMLPKKHQVRVVLQIQFLLIFLPLPISFLLCMQRYCGCYQLVKTKSYDCLHHPTLRLLFWQSHYYI